MRTNHRKTKKINKKIKYKFQNRLVVLSARFGLKFFADHRLDCKNVNDRKSEKKVTMNDAIPL